MAQALPQSDFDEDMATRVYQRTARVRRKVSELETVILDKAAIAALARSRGRNRSGWSRQALMALAMGTALSVAIVISFGFIFRALLAQ